MSNHNYPGDLLLLLGESNHNLLFPQDPNTVLDLTNPEAWKLLIQPDQQDGDDDTHEAPTTHVDLEIPNVYYHLEQKGDYFSLMEDVDQFMQRTMIEDDTINQFKRAGTLDTPWCQNVTQKASGPRESQRDAVDWCQHCQSTICITKTTTTMTDYRKVPAPPSRVIAAAAPPRASSSFPASSSSRTATVPTTSTTGITVTVSTADRNQLMLRQQESADPGDLDPHDLAMLTNPMNDAATTTTTPPQQRPILLCKPLTAYNYFYRIERANIVSGMACATDPIPPVDHNVSLEQREKLLQQRWYVESTKKYLQGLFECSKEHSLAKLCCKGMRIQNEKSDRIERRMVSLIL
jgi:hypothetical protein